jgi:hypothetical protein
MKFDIWIFFENLSKKFQVLLKYDNNKNSYFMWRLTYIFDNISLNFHRMRNVSEKVVEKIKTHILCSVTSFFFKWCHSRDNVEKYGTARQITDWNIVECRKEERMQTHTHAVYYFLLFHCSSGYIEAPQCYIACTLLVFHPIHSELWSAHKLFSNIHKLYQQMI